MAKLSHKEVEYEHPAKMPPNNCAHCMHSFRRNRNMHCEIVVDPIRPEDWCNKYEREEK